jgi:lysozyme
MPSRRDFLRVGTGAAAAAVTAGPAAAQATQLEGIDVSHWQGVINWAAVAGAGIAFAYMKATEGRTFVDDRFAANWAAAKANGIARGAYHFGRPGTDPVAQARHFYNTVRPGSGDLPLCLDIEATDSQTPTQVRNWIQRFVTEIKRRMGRPPVIYTGYFFWQDNAGNSPNNYDTMLWMARWSTTPLPLPIAWTNWTFWQYTSTGTVPGVSGNCDRDRFNGTSSALQGLGLP